MIPIAARHKGLIVAATLLLGACGAQPPADPEAAAAPAVLSPSAVSPAPSMAQAATKPSMAVEGEGLRLFNPVTGSASPLPFGRPQVDVLAALERMLGPSERGDNPECGAGPIHYANWPDGLGVVFQENRFVGWSLGRNAAGHHSTAAGVGPGSTREDMEAAYADVEVMQSSLGDEFSAGGFFGVLDGPNAGSKITAMWGGVACIAR